MKTVLKTGAWDILHRGHLNVLQIAANLGSFLVVGVGTDEYIKGYKGKKPVFPFSDRAAVIASLRMVDAVIPYSRIDDLALVKVFNVDIIVVDQYFGLGDSPHAKKQYETRKLMEAMGIQYVIVPRTDGISSSYIKERINEEL